MRLSPNVEQRLRKEGLSLTQHRWIRRWIRPAPWRSPRSPGPRPTDRRFPPRPTDGAERSSDGGRGKTRGTDELASKKDHVPTFGEEFSVTSSRFKMCFCHIYKPWVCCKGKAVSHIRVVKKSQQVDIKLHGCAVKYPYVKGCNSCQVECEEPMRMLVIQLYLLISQACKSQ